MNEETISPEEGQTILSNAKLFLGSDSNGNPKYKYVYGGNGVAKKGKGTPGIDCSHLVYQSLAKSGLKIPYSHVITSSLNSNESDTDFIDIKQQGDVRAGDLIVFIEHVGVVETIYMDSSTGKYRGTFIHSESYSKGPTRTGFILDPGSKRPGYNKNYYGAKVPVTKFLRPKKKQDETKKEVKPKKNAEGARINSEMYVVCTNPDVCKTPMSSSTVPVPYQIVGNLGDSASISPNVRFADNNAFLLDKSIITKVTGDEAGTSGGVSSGTNVSTCEAIEGCKTFRINGKQVVAHGDKFKMNNGNTLGKAVCQVSGAPASGIENGKPTGDTNPPRTV
jgi:hypothetical protein